MSLVRIDKLFNYRKGTLQSSKCTPGKYPFITAAAEWKTHTEYEEDGEALIFAAAASGSLGRTHYVNEKFISSDLCFILTPKDEEIYPIDLHFYHIIFNQLKNDIVKNTKAGTSKEAIGLGAFGRYKLPYFNIEQQQKVKAQFLAASATQTELSQEFSHQLSLLKKLRQSLLQDAVQGRLVAQDTSDEPASVLLEKIKAEKEKLIQEKKIKKSKSLPPIKEEEIPFELPEGWVWCRLGEIALFSKGGKSIQANPQPASNTCWGVLKTSAVTSGEFIEVENKEFENKKGEFADILVQKGDLLFCRASGSKGLAGTSCIVRTQPQANLILSDKTIRYHLSGLVFTEYLQIWNSSSFSKYYYNSLSTGKSTSMNNITREQFDEMILPLPPLPEQHRIVEKLESLLAHGDALEQQVLESQKSAGALLQVALKEALERPVEVII